MARYTRLSAKLKQAFVDRLRDTGNVTGTTRELGVSRMAAYKARAKDPAFARAWDEAVAEAIDLLELEARRRAVEGVTRERGIYYKGDLVGTEIITEYSDQLLMFLLRGHRPEKYRERVEVSVLDRVREMAGDFGIDPDEAVKAAQAILAKRGKGSPV